MSDQDKTTQELKDEQAKIDVSQKLPVQEWQRRWARIDAIEAELDRRGELRRVTYNQD